VQLITEELFNIDEILLYPQLRYIIHLTPYSIFMSNIANVVHCRLWVRELMGIFVGCEEVLWFCDF
jgi:hypothetical protein